MSIENHPNFHACNFATKVMEAYYESLRGKASKENTPAPTALFANFVLDVEEIVDECVEDNSLPSSVEKTIVKLQNENIKKLKIKEGDFVIVKSLSAEDAYKFAIDLEGKIPPKATVCFLQEGQTIETLDEEEMEKCGWVRKTNRRKQ